MRAFIANTKASNVQIFYQQTFFRSCPSLYDVFSFALQLWSGLQVSRQAMALAVSLNCPHKVVHIIVCHVSCYYILLTVLVKYIVLYQERRGVGTTDGTFKHTTYFRCDHDCGVFVAIDKLINPCADDTDLSQFAQKASRSDSLKIGDNVIVYDDKDQPIRGTVRWIGVNKAAAPSGDEIVGIETVSYLKIMQS